MDERLASNKKRRMEKKRRSKGARTLKYSPLPIPQLLQGINNLILLFRWNVSTR